MRAPWSSGFWSSFPGVNGKLRLSGQGSASYKAGVLFAKYFGDPGLILDSRQAEGPFQIPASQ